MMYVTGEFRSALYVERIPNRSNVVAIGNYFGAGYVVKVVSYRYR